MGWLGVYFELHIIQIDIHTQLVLEVSSSVILWQIIYSSDKKGAHIFDMIAYVYYRCLCRGVWSETYSPVI